MRKLMVVLILLLTFVGCVGVPIAPLAPEDKERLYQSDFNVTWHGVLDVINEKELPITTIEKESGIVVTDFVIIPFTFASSRPDLFPAQPLEMIQQGRYKLNISVRSASVSTKVRINAHFEKFSHIAFIEQFPSWKIQASTGILEKELFNAIESSIQPPSK